MKGNKKIKMINYRRKEMLISDPLNDLQNDKKKEQEQQKESKQEPIMPKQTQEKLEIPKTFKIEENISKFRFKLIAAIEAKEPILPLQKLFQNEQWKMVIGKTEKESKVRKKSVQVEDIKENYEQPEESYFDQISEEKGFKDLIIPGYNYEEQESEGDNYFEEMVKNPRQKDLEFVFGNEKRDSFKFMDYHAQQYEIKRQKHRKKSKR